jgi:hypothetical protein
MVGGDHITRQPRPSGITPSNPTHCQNGNAELEAGRARRRALLAEVERSRVEFEEKWNARAEVLGRRFWLFRLGHINRQYRKTTPYPDRQPDREEGWKPVKLPHGVRFPWERSK